MYNTQLNAWKYSYNAHKMQCMKFLRVNLQNPSRKFHKNLFDFEKPQILQKSQKFRFQRMKCMKMRESKLTKWREILENAWKILGKEVWSEREWFGRWTGSEKSRKWELDHDNSIYRASVILDRLKCWEVSSHLLRKVSRKKTLTDAAIEEVLRNDAKTLEEKLD